jgi:hypothetical protein
VEDFFGWVISNKEWLFSGLGLVIVAWVGRLIFKKIHASSTQNIRSGDNSTNVQANRDINIGTKKKGKDVGKG